MTAILAGLPSMPTDAAPLILPGLLAGLGVTAPRVPRWITDTDAIASIEAGLYEIPDELLGETS